MFTAPLGVYLHFKIGSRWTLLLGAFLTAVGIGFVPLITNLGLLFLCYGVLGGVGIMLQINPPFILLSEYFPYDHPRHVLATSVTACAFPLGKPCCTYLVK